MPLPPLTLDLSINIATLVMVLVGVWKASALVSEVRATRADLTEHTEKEERVFQDWRARFHEQSQRLTAVQLAAGIQESRLGAAERQIDGLSKRS